MPNLSLEVTLVDQLMTNMTKNLQRHKQENNFEEFYKKILTLVPELKTFMIGSLKALEDQGKLDKRYYDADEMLDEVYLDSFKLFSSATDTTKLRRSLFKNAIKKIETKRAQEIPDNVNTHSLLKAELKTLNVEFTTEADGDRILFEDLDDISYRQKRGWQTVIYLNDHLEKQLVDKLGLKETSLLSDEKRRTLGILYSTIPERSKTIIELQIFGDQDNHEISEILEVPEELVERILFKVRERFKLV